MIVWAIFLACAIGSFVLAALASPLFVLCTAGAILCLWQEFIAVERVRHGRR